jgi:hypothetical protein
MNKAEVKDRLRPLVETLKSLEDAFGVDIRITETDWTNHYPPEGENYSKLKDGSRSDRIIVDIRLAHDSRKNTPCFVLASENCSDYPLSWEDDI